MYHLPYLSPLSPFFLLVQGDIYEPSWEGHVSEAGVDGLKGRNSSIAPTRYRIKWISRKLDAISCTVLHQIVVESIQVVGVFFSIFYLFMVVVVVSLFDRQRVQTDRLCFCELWWKQTAVNSASSEIQFVHFSAIYIVMMRLFQHPPFLLVIKPVAWPDALCSSIQTLDKMYSEFHTGRLAHGNGIHYSKPLRRHSPCPCRTAWNSSQVLS